MWSIDLARARAAELVAVHTTDPVSGSQSDRA